MIYIYIYLYIYIYILVCVHYTWHRHVERPLILYIWRREYHLVYIFVHLMEDNPTNSLLPALDSPILGLQTCVRCLHDRESISNMMHETCQLTNGSKRTKKDQKGPEGPFHPYPRLTSSCRGDHDFISYPNTPQLQHGSGRSLKDQNGTKRDHQRPKKDHNVHFIHISGSPQAARETMISPLTPISLSSNMGPGGP